MFLKFCLEDVLNTTEDVICCHCCLRKIWYLHSNNGSDFVSSLIFVSSFWNAASTTSPALTTHASTVTEANVTIFVAPQNFTHTSPDHSPNQTLSFTVPTGNVFNLRGRSPLQCCPQLSLTAGRSSLLCSVSAWWCHLWSFPSAAVSKATASSTTMKTSTTMMAQMTTMIPTTMPQPKFTDTTSNGWRSFSWYSEHKSVLTECHRFLLMFCDLSVRVLYFDFFFSLFYVIWIYRAASTQPPQANCEYILQVFTHILTTLIANFTCLIVLKWFPHPPVLCNVREDIIFNSEKKKKKRDSSSPYQPIFCLHQNNIWYSRTFKP